MINQVHKVLFDNRNQLEDVMLWTQRFYFGTWQLSGDFRTLSLSQKESLIVTALKQGVSKFDTAVVYGRGEVESLLGRMVPQKVVILTKIPAMKKPEQGKIIPIELSYTQDFLRISLEGSLRRLERQRVDIALLHNWHEAWGRIGGIQIIESLNQMKQSGLVERIGISLPDRFGSSIDMEILKHIDVIEAPFNPQDTWILSQLPFLRSCGVEVVLRSVLMQGMLVKTRNEIEKLSNHDVRRKYIGPLSGTEACPLRLLEKAWALNTSMTVGMTSPEQIIENINQLKGVVS